MKQHHKVGNRPGRPAYRTASAFRARQFKNIERATIAFSRNRKKR